MKNSMSRRQFGALMGGSVMAGAMGSMVSAAGESLRLIWWGNPERDKRTYAVVDLYKAAAGADIQPETYAWGDYWQKLATQAAGRNLPDVIQMLPVLAWWAVGGGTWAAVQAFAIAMPGQEPVMPGWVTVWSHTIHCIAHSAVIVAGAWSHSVRRT